MTSNKEEHLLSADMVHILADIAAILGCTWDTSQGYRKGDPMSYSWWFDAYGIYEDEGSSLPSVSITQDRVSKRITARVWFDAVRPEDAPKVLQVIGFLRWKDIETAVE